MADNKKYDVIIIGAGPAGLAALKGTGEIEFLDIAIDGDDVAINLNNEPVPTNPFVSTFIRNTVVGMVSSLKGVSNTQKIDVSIRW